MIVIEPYEISILCNICDLQYLKVENAVQLEGSQLTDKNN